MCALVTRNKNFPSQRVDEFNTIEYFPSVQSEKTNSETVAIADDHPNLHEFFLRNESVFLGNCEHRKKKKRFNRILLVCITSFLLIFCFGGLSVDWEFPF